MGPTLRGWRCVKSERARSPPRTNFVLFESRRGSIAVVVRRCPIADHQRASIDTLIRQHGAMPSPPTTAWTDRVIAPAYSVVTASDTTSSVASTNNGAAPECCFEASLRGRGPGAERLRARPRHDSVQGHTASSREAWWPRPSAGPRDLWAPGRNGTGSGGAGEAAPCSWPVLGSASSDTSVRLARVWRPERLRSRAPILAARSAKPRTQGRQRGHPARRLPNKKMPPHIFRHLQPIRSSFRPAQAGSKPT
ncbi:MAG: hypothetical protein JG765_2667 [Cereibacter sp.]|jgi:hypothetical protein|nr:hypothetical protein [Cereibacter sp.]